ncbi:MAG: hypothetical protein COB66_01555 [Coxiella sp. (in: Bacteria)]|nr:MAG: hypothetical protein COB66_01555 [Coxiella sp. (in: g-proteobacteria)]
MYFIDKIKGIKRRINRFRRAINAYALEQQNVESCHEVGALLDQLRIKAIDPKIGGPRDDLIESNQKNTMKTADKLDVLVDEVMKLKGKNTDLCNGVIALLDYVGNRITMRDGKIDLFGHIQFFEVLTHLVRPNVKIPPIFINAVPKSGSMYMATRLSKGLKVPFLSGIDHGYFPNFYIVPMALEYFLKGNSIVQEHLDANPVNITFLERYKVKFVLNIRDPRQATLSWVHNQNRWLHQDQPDLVVPYPPERYINWPLSGQIDWHIEIHLKALANWLREWMVVLKQDKLEILVTRYEDMINNEAEFFDRILEFYEIPPAAFQPIELEKKSDATHFRNGVADEWKSVFSQEQIQRCNDIIGDELFDYFGWAKEDCLIPSS